MNHFTYSLLLVLSEANRNATSRMCNKCTVLLMEPSELYMHERNPSKRATVAVSPSAFPQRHSLGDAGYLLILILYAAHADVCVCIVSHCKKEERERERSVCFDIYVWWLDLTINNLHGVFTTPSHFPCLVANIPTSLTHLALRASRCIHKPLIKYSSKALLAAAYVMCPPCTVTALCYFANIQQLWW